MMVTGPKTTVGDVEAVSRESDAAMFLSTGEVGPSREQLVDASAALKTTATTELVKRDIVLSEPDGGHQRD
jgi:hypothetical protein